MLVKFESTWFAPSEEVIVDKLRKISGQRFRKGVHEVPDELLGMLPKTATILKEKEIVKQEEIKQSDDLKDYDSERIAMDDFVKRAEKAEAEAKLSITERRRNQMAKAREAKNNKQIKEQVTAQVDVVEAST